jgi:hypothetical protein
MTLPRYAADYAEVRAFAARNAIPVTGLWTGFLRTGLSAITEPPAKDRDLITPAGPDITVFPERNRYRRGSDTIPKRSERSKHHSPSAADIGWSEALRPVSYDEFASL